jgi:hypothetical protein
LPKNKLVIRHAYENALTACARLASFALSEPINDAGHRISERQKILAANDLVVFAINARRLMDAVRLLGQFTRVTLPTVVKKDQALAEPVKSDVAITKIINALIHHNALDIIRFMREVLPTGGLSALEMMKRYEEVGDASFPPMIHVRSERYLFVFRLKDILEIFARDVLDPIVDACDAYHLFLDADRD